MNRKAVRLHLGHLLARFKWTHMVPVQLEMSANHSAGYSFPENRNLNGDMCMIGLTSTRRSHFSTLTEMGRDTDRWYLKYKVWQETYAWSKEYNNNNDMIRSNREQTARVRYLLPRLTGKPKKTWSQHGLYSNNRPETMITWTKRRTCMNPTGTGVSFLIQLQQFFWVKSRRGWIEFFWNDVMWCDVMWCDVMW